MRSTRDDVRTIAAVTNGRRPLTERILSRDCGSTSTVAHSALGATAAQISVTASKLMVAVFAFAPAAGAASVLATSVLHDPSFRAVFLIMGRVLPETTRAQS